MLKFTTEKVETKQYGNCRNQNIRYNNVGVVRENHSNLVETRVKQEIQ